MSQAVFETSHSFRSRGGSLSLATALLWLQGAYYVLTGLWPLVSIQTFEMVTGVKTDNLPTGRQADHWLVMTVSVLVTAVALTLLTAAWRRAMYVELAVLAIGCALGLTAIDVTYVTRQVIAPIYLLDAAIQLPLIAAWIVSLARENHPLSTNR
jgi:hypothetical protein